MAQVPEITQDSFEKLLNWLDPSRDQAAIKYESIRTRLIKLFCARGCRVAEELADETIDRVTKKSAELAASYKGDPALFFYGVAKKVFLEFTRRPRFEELSPTTTREAAPSSEDPEIEQYASCLDKCLEGLETTQHRLIITYYQGEHGEKIARRKRLQFELGISSEALRVRVLRIRSSLQKCVLKCVHVQVS